MKYFKFTYVDSVTGVSVATTPATNGVKLPAFAEYTLLITLESEFPTNVPIFIGECPDYVDLNIEGVIAVLTELEKDSAIAAEIQAMNNRALNYTRQYILDQLDILAQERDYLDFQDLCSYGSDPIPLYAAESYYGVETRSNAWAVVDQIEADLLAEVRARAVSESQFIPELPEISWDGFTGGGGGGTSSGITSFDYTSANNTFVIGRAEGGTFAATIDTVNTFTVSRDLTVSGNLTVSGTTTYINTTQLNVGDNQIVLNADLGAVAPTENAGFTVNRGSSANVEFVWVEAGDYWAIGNTSVTGYVNASSTITGSQLVSTVATGTPPLTVTSTTTVTNLNADLLDGYQSSALINSTHTGVSATTNLTTGWYTVAIVAGNGINSANRATARFAIKDVTPGRHQGVVFYASHYYGADASNNLTVLDNSYFSGNPFRYIRIKEGGTYDGAALQVYVDDATNNLTAYLLGDNFQLSGWVLTNFIADTTDPGSVANYGSWTEKVIIDLDEVANGGVAASGPFVSTQGTTRLKGAVSSTNTTTGSLVVTGGVGVSESLYANALNSSTSLLLGSTSSQSTGTFTTVSTAQVAIDTFATASYRTVKYLIQMTSGTAYHAIELLAIHDGTTVQLAQYGEIKTGTSLGTLDASISAGTFSLLFTATNASTTVKFSRMLLVV